MAEGGLLGNVVSQDELIRMRQEWKAASKPVVLVCGLFDLLHPGHVRLLEQARALGEVLVVAVESDASATKKAASDKLVNPASERAEVLAALEAIDYVVEFSRTPSDGLVSRLAPEIVVEGGASPDRTDTEVEVSATKVIRIPLEPGYSTAMLLERIRQLQA
jgi:rfaE bifunctional protein nucleotidyltransferase chain/domain